MSSSPKLCAIFLGLQDFQRVEVVLEHIKAECSIKSLKVPHSCLRCCQMSCQGVNVSSWAKM